MAKLIIVESPTKVKTISKFLESGYKVISTVGHFRDLPKSRLGVDVENGFEPEFDIIEGKEKIVKELKRQAGVSDAIILAPDPDREGEAIAWHVLEELKSAKLANKPVYRVEFHEITKRAVKRALETPREIDEGLVDAYKARRVLDRLVGYRISPVLWRKVRPGLSAGRVQSVAVRLICEREEAIKSFTHEEFWELRVLFENKAGEHFYAKLFKIDGEDVKIESEKAMEVVLKNLEKAPFFVDALSEKEFTRKPPPPFTTSTLQQEANRKFGWSGKRTMQVAQSLYEGVDLEGATEGLITYMRTDSVRISEEGIEQARRTIGRMFEPSYLPDKPNQYTLKSKSGVQDAHEAIRPTDTSHNPDSVKRFLKSDQFKLYNLVWMRFIACQMSSAKFNSRTVDIASGKYLFRAVDTKSLFAGFLKLYDPRSDERFAEEGTDSDEKTDKYPLPDSLEKGDDLNANEYFPSKHFTKPPARYNDASLVKTLEEFGIGRPSTYAAIIDTIIVREYVARENRSFVPTDWGFAVTQLMKAYFDSIIEVGFTADMESKLDEVAEGKSNWQSVVSQFWQTLANDIDVAMGDDKRFKPQPVETEILCTECGSKMLIRQGKFGKFLGCSNFPVCKSTRPLDKPNGETQGRTNEAIKTGEKCPSCGIGELVVRRSKWGSQFMACNNYPKCKYSGEVQTKCPKCGKEMERRVLPNKRKVYVCVDEEGCRFRLYGSPVWKKCAKCGSFLAERKRKGQNEVIRFCSHPDCEDHSSTE
jgi:DNA topoisomerase-1